LRYRSVIVTKRGAPEVLQVIENDLCPPSAGEARIKILATPVCQDDVAVRIGNRPFLAKIPFVPGYTILGVVDAIGEGVTNVALGDRVAALTNFGGYAEYIFLGEDQLVHVPLSLDPAEAVVLILNYVVAYQVLHQSAQVKPGDKVLILVHYGGPQSFSRFLLLMVKFILYNLLPNGKAIKGYGTHRGNINLFKEDWAKLFKLLEEGQIKPIIAEKFPILEAAQANALLESGQVIGNIVLLAPELL
jgi:NADPH:quinone reductase-like Zn-dependent oxidoreductase